MNKRYIDFVPTKGAESNNAKAKTAKVSDARVSGVKTERTIARRVVTNRVSATTHTKKTGVAYRSMPETPRTESRKTKRGLREDDGLELGVIEDLGTRFVSSEIEKRPLGGNRSAQKEEVKEIKSRKLLGRRVKKTGNEPVENSEKAEVNETRKMTYKMPKNPFINQEKVIKRPLSKNVYQKTVEAPTEKPSGPVAIITKPEKDRKVSLVVTIIITIILGAAAGTVAFLLLPK